MTSKTLAITSGASSALLGFASYIADMPNSTQDALAGALVNLFPVAYRGTVGTILKALSMVALYTAIHYASKSPDPITAPVNGTVSSPVK